MHKPLFKRLFLAGITKTRLITLVPVMLCLENKRIGFKVDLNL